MLTAEPTESAAAARLAAAHQLAGEYQSLVLSHRIASNPRGGQQGGHAFRCKLAARVRGSVHRDAKRTQ